jgi:hypothetical protein
VGMKILKHRFLLVWMMVWIGVTFRFLLYNILPRLSTGFAQKEK